jgi:uncharacterized protein
MLLVLLLISLAIVTFDLTKGSADFREFKLFQDTGRRQRTLRRWLVQSFVLYGIAGAAGLAVTGRLGVLARVPDEFRYALGMVEPLATAGHNESSVSFATVLIVCFILGVTVTVVALIARRRVSAAKTDTSPPMAGDYAALIPRNAAERRWAVLLSLNAGLSEELFFRAWLPVLLYALCHNAIASLVIATLLFGAMHAYQGFKGIAATTVIGGVFTFIYVSSGQIWIAMILHALIDLNSLILQPMLTAKISQA